MRENAHHEDEGSGDGASDRHRKDRDDDQLRDVNVGKWVIGGLSTWELVGCAFSITGWEGNRLNASRAGSTPGLEDGSCNCAIVTRKTGCLEEQTKGKKCVHPGAPEGDEVPPKIPEVFNDDAEEGNSLGLFQMVRLLVRVASKRKRTKWAKPAVA